MQKSLNAQELATARRNNSIMLAVLFMIILLSSVLAFGYQILYIVAIFGLPVLLHKIWEEVNQQYISRKPKSTQKSS